jgi:hypothetical protein
MGADIHAYVEYSDFKTADGEQYWTNFTRNGGERNYYLFGLLAGVRGEEAPLFSPRGLPDGHLGYWTEDDYWLHVAPADKPGLADSDGWTSTANAERWLERGYVKADRREDGSLSRVSHPDWHSHSWLTADELAQVLDRYAKGVQRVWSQEKADAPTEWKAVLAAMRSFEADGHQARVVFWFDN